MRQAYATGRINQVALSRLAGAGNAQPGLRLGMFFAERTPASCRPPALGRTTCGAPRQAFGARGDRSLFDTASGYRSTTGGGGGGEARVRASDAGFEKPRVRRKPRRVRRTGVPAMGHPRTPRRAPLKDHWGRRDVSISPRTGRPRDSREGSEPPRGCPGP